MAELKRKQTTAVVLLGVIGAEFGQDVGESTKKRSDDQRRKSSVVEGFGIGNNNLARLTSNLIIFMYMVRIRVYLDKLLLPFSYVTADDPCSYGCQL